MKENLFAERLAFLRNEKGLKREDIAKVLGCSVSAVGNYENGNRTPDFNGLITLANLFETTTDYLLGITDIKTNNKDLSFVCEYTGLSELTIETLKIRKKTRLEFPDDNETLSKKIAEEYININLPAMQDYACQYFHNLQTKKDKLNNAILKVKTNDKADNELNKVFLAISEIDDKLDLILFKTQEINKYFIKDFNKHLINEINLLEKEYNLLFKNNIL